jgi:hypothetical protein
MKQQYGAPKKDDPRAYKVSVMLTKSELEFVDAHRGELTRSSFARQCILQLVAQKEALKLGWDKSHD